MPLDRNARTYDSFLLTNLPVGLRKGMDNAFEQHPFWLINMTHIFEYFFQNMDRLIYPVVLMEKKQVYGFQIPPSEEDAEESPLYFEMTNLTNNGEVYKKIYRVYHKAPSNEDATFTDQEDMILFYFEVDENDYKIKYDSIHSAVFIYEKLDKLFDEEEQGADSGLIIGMTVDHDGYRSL